MHCGVNRLLIVLIYWVISQKKIKEALVDINMEVCVMYIFMSYYLNAGHNRNMKVACKPIKYMAEFKHLGMTLRNEILQEFRSV
jgi:hypothetical protein